MPPHAGWSPGLRELLSKETIEERMAQAQTQEPRTGSRSLTLQQLVLAVSLPTANRLDHQAVSEGDVRCGL